MIKVFEAFAGIGTQRMALKRAGIEHEVVGIAEIDKFAIKSYEAIHGETYNVGDISEVSKDDIPSHDLFTYSFPCQDISVAGKQGGLDKGSGTRSSLLWECNRVIETIKPKYLLMENVKNLVGKKHKPNFEKWLEHLEDLGYTNYWEVLNAKDYGIPQNRERVFVVSILGDHQPYEFPKPVKLELRLKDVLEDEVDEKFYLSDEQTKRLTGNTFHQANVRLQEKDYSDTLLARDYKDPKCVRVGGIFDKDGTKHQAGAIWDKNHLSPTLDTMQGGWRQPSIITHNYTEQVKVRKHEVDIDGLRDLLKSHKRSSGKTNREISELLNEPMTLVEHWFRNDSSFAIPKEDKWLRLKEILSISTDSFDKQIMEFEIRDGVFDQANRAYDSAGVSPTLTATDADKKILIKNATKKGYIEATHGDGVDLAYPDSETRRGRVQKGLSQTLDTGDSKGVVIGASRGRNPENPSDRTVGSPTEQRLEINKQGTSNAITTVHKDNYVVEPLGTLAAHNSDKFGTGYMDGVSKTLKANKHDISVLYSNLRIRKLTPKECWRLMGCTDEDFHKAQAFNSNTQLYKQAGNAIVVDVLEMIFSEMFRGS